MTDVLEAMRQAIREIVREEVRAALAVARPAPSEYLTTAEAAEHARVKPDTVRRWVKRGELPAVAAGRHLRVRRADVERLMTGVNRGTLTDAELDALVARDMA